MTEPLPPLETRVAQLERRLDAAERRHAKQLEAISEEFRKQHDRITALEPIEQ
jgi:hypothetical protein